jgi:hypothetical protein
MADVVTEREEVEANQLAIWVHRHTAAPQPICEKWRKMMTDRNFTMTFTVDQTPREAFEAIKNARGWWPEEIEGSTGKLGDEFTYHYKDVHTCRMKLVEFVPNQRVVWLVLDNYFNFTEDKTEWKGTKIIFEVSKRGDKTEVHFTHEGLVPQYECFNVCSNAWGSYINGSLRGLIATGKGKPNQKEKEDPSVEIDSPHPSSL